MSFNLERKGITIKVRKEYNQSMKYGEQEQKQKSIPTNFRLRNLRKDLRKNRDNKKQKEKRRLGSLTQINQKLRSKTICTAEIMQTHPEIWPNLRVK
eukprot:UN11013